jgi:hypothetical protein
MATFTTNLNLRKPSTTDTINVSTDIGANMDILDAHAHSGTYERVFGVAAPTGVAATDTAAIAAQLALAAAAGGGTVVIAPGLYPISSTLTIPENTRLVGAGWQISGLVRTSNITMLDFVGAHADTTTTDFLDYCSVEDMSIFGDGRTTIAGSGVGGHSTWSTTGVRVYHARHIDWTDVRFFGFFGVAVKGLEWFDSCLTRVRFDWCGFNDLAALHLIVSEDASGIGHAVEPTNNINFDNVTFETCGRAIRAERGATGGSHQINKLYWKGVKVESSQMMGPAVEMLNCLFLDIDGLNVTCNGIRSGSTGPFDATIFDTCQGVKVDGFFGEANPSFGTSVTRTLLRIDDCNDSSFDKLFFGNGATNYPSVAAVEFAGTNSDVTLGTVGWAYDNTAGAAVLVSGAPTSAVQGQFSVYATDPTQLTFRVRGTTAQTGQLIKAETVLGTELASLSVAGSWRTNNQGVGSGSDASGGSRVLTIQEVATAPGTPSTGIIAYVESGVLKFIDTTGIKHAFNNGDPAATVWPPINGGAGAWPASNEGHYYRLQRGGTFSKVGLHIGVQSGNISIAGYTNSGVGRAAQPTGGRVFTTGAIACPAVNYQEVSLGASFTLHEGDWLGMSADNTTVTIRCADTGYVASSTGLGAHLLQSTAHPLPATPASMSGALGRVAVLIGVT